MGDIPTIETGYVCAECNRYTKNDGDIWKGTWYCRDCMCKDEIPLGYIYQQSPIAQAEQYADWLDNHGTFEKNLKRRMRKNGMLMLTWFEKKNAKKAAKNNNSN